MNWLERTIAFLSPRIGSERAFYRLQLELARGYDAAQAGRLQNGRRRPGTSANAEIAKAGTHIRFAARELVRNNPHAKKAKRIYVANLVGTGIVPTANTGNKTRDGKINKAFEAWCRQADLAGRLDFFGLQAQLGGGLMESGEMLARLYDRRPGPALRLQPLEPDHLDLTRYLPGQDVGAGNYVDQGIEFDGDSRPVAYHLFPQHPGDSIGLKRFQSVRVSAERVVHVFPAHLGRAGQIRGVSEYAAVQQRLADLGEYDEATLVGKKIAACFAAFVKRSGSAASPLAGAAATTDDKNRRIETLAPGIIQYLGLDESVEFGEPPAVGDYSPYTDAQLHAIAAGLNVMYEGLTGDLSKVNYSSFRAGQNDFRRAIEMDQWLMLIPMFCNPVWRAFVDRLVIAGEVQPAFGDAHYGVDWATPRWESVDPSKDAGADREDIRSGLVTLKQAIARRGYNPDEVLRQHAETGKLLDQLGLTLDTDPRKVTRNGGPMSAPAADQLDGSAAAASSDTP